MPIPQGLPPMPSTSPLQDPLNPVQSVNPMQGFAPPTSPDQQYQMMMLMQLLGGLGPQVPPTPQPNPSMMPPLLGGPIPGR